MFLPTAVRLMPKAQIIIEALPKGIYLLNVQAGSMVYTSRFIKE